MSALFDTLTIPFLLAMFLALNMGASGTAPSFSAAYGANVIKRTMIPGLFGIMVLAGALIAGEEVSLTLGKGLLEQHFFTPMITSVILMSVGLSLLVANLIGVPQSTSQSTVLAIAGAATALDGLDVEKLVYDIIPTWVILPIVAFILMLSFTQWIWPRLSRKITARTYNANGSSSKGIRIFLLLSSLYVAFSIGANNVANAAAPIASLTANQLGVASSENFLPIIILSFLVVAPCFAIGSSLLGHKVTENTGKNIVEVTPFYASIIALLTASLLIYASVVKGVPTSLVQMNGAAFIALAVSKHGWSTTFKNRIVRRFFLVWAIAPLISYILTYGLVAILQG